MAKHNTQNSVVSSLQSCTYSWPFGSDTDQQLGACSILPPAGYNKQSLMELRQNKWDIKNDKNAGNCSRALALPRQIRNYVMR